MLKNWFPIFYKGFINKLKQKNYIQMVTYSFVVLSYLRNGKLEKLGGMPYLD
jgi:hypothetical protein